MKILIKGATLVNDDRKYTSDLLIENERIARISPQINVPDARIIQAEGKYLLPGIIDDQVHFREPGLTHKGHIASESAAAVAGGVTSFIDQPNTIPNTTTQELLEAKYQLAEGTSFANYGFMLGGTNDNLKEILKTNPQNVPGIKLFLGSSTGNMLVDDPETLEKIFESTPMLIAVHCEDEATIAQNLQKMKDRYGDEIPMSAHPLIRSAKACYLSSSRAIELAKKTGARLHIFHLSTAEETYLLDNHLPLEQKKITAEVCVHHLWFSDKDYASKGSLIKWNPAVKSAQDREKLWEALLDGRIDVIATDHAPHTLAEKARPYNQCPSGGPLIQHSLLAMLEKSSEGKIPLEVLVRKMAHNPATLFRIQQRGFLREGYFADLVLVDPRQNTTVTTDQILYHCGWSPLEGTTFHHSITHTFVNGQLAFHNGQLTGKMAGKRMLYN